MARGPARLNPMVNLHVHVMPEQVWNDYMRLLGGSSQWQSLTDRYGINVVIGEPGRSRALRRAMGKSDAWTLEYEDAQAFVFVRRKPIASPERRADGP